jgi:CBS domain-containing protein
LAVFVTTVARAAMPKSGAWAGKASATILSLGGSTGVIPMSVEQKRVPSNATDPNSPPLDDVFAYFLWELPLFAMLAAVAAVLGAILTRASSALSPRRPTSPRARVMEAALVAGVCAALAVCAAASLGACLPREDNTERTSHSVDGTDYVHGLACPKGHVNDVATLLLGLRDDIISELLSASSDFTPLAIAASLVALLTTIPFACDVSFPCGLFMPTIAWGAMLGSLWGTFVRFVVERLAGADVADRVSPGSYAVVGAASALAGMFRSSISLVVIMVEGTGRVGALMPLLLGVAVANLVGPRVHGESFYESQLRTKGVPFLRPRHAHAPKNGSRRFDTGDGARVSSSEDFCVQTTVSSLIAAHPVCFGEKTTVREVTDVLLHTKHNGFPVVSGAGKLVGFMLRSQLMVLLARREFVENQTNDLPRNGTANEPIEPTADEPVAPTLEQSRVAERRVLANDAAMRTFHHRHEFSDRSVSLSSEAVSRLGLTPLELDKHMYLTDYMKIAPLAVYSQCAAWRAAGYFRYALGLSQIQAHCFLPLSDCTTSNIYQYWQLSIHQKCTVCLYSTPIPKTDPFRSQPRSASGLRHLPVVDSLNNVVGVLTRRDLVPGFWNRPCADLTVVRPNGASTTLDVTERRARNAWTSWRRAGDAPDVSPDIPTHFFETNTSPDTA